VSFASNHSAPNNTPFTTIITIANPLNPAETETTRLWPDHCVQGTPGAELIPELDIDKIDEVVEKGMDKRVEMYSAFQDPFTSPTVYKSRMAEVLKQSGITDVFVCGLAHDYCVKYTAIDATKEGFKTYLIEDATRAVDPADIPAVNAEMEKFGVIIVDSKGPEVRRVKS
jgi:nicotinamidase-related amidase